MKESSNTDCVVNKKSVKTSNGIGQSLPGVQIHLNFAQKSCKYKSCIFYQYLEIILSYDHLSNE